MDWKVDWLTGKLAGGLESCLNHWEIACKGLGRRFQQNKQKKRKNEKQRVKKRKRSIQRYVVGKKRTYILTDSLSSEMDEAPVDLLDSLAL